MMSDFLCSQFKDEDKRYNDCWNRLSSETKASAAKAKSWLDKLLWEENVLQFPANPWLS